MSKNTRRFNQYQANHNLSSEAGKGGFLNLAQAALLVGVVMFITWLIVKML